VSFSCVEDIVKFNTVCAIMLPVFNREEVAPNG